MKKNVLFLIIIVLNLISKLAFSQAEISHPFQQDIEISVPGKGGPTLIKQGETKVLPYVTTNGKEKIVVRYRTSRNSYVSRPIIISIVGGKAELPLADDAFVEKKPKTDQPRAASEIITQPSQHSSGSPRVGDVNIITGLETKVDEFQITVVNNTTKGDLIFIGDVFTGAAFSQGDTLVSKTTVRPGLIEFNVLYQDHFFMDKGVIGRPIILLQQSIVAMVTRSQNIITIEDSHFFNVYELAPDLKVIFENVGPTTLMSNPPGKRPLRPGRKSQVYSFEEATKLSWSFTEKGVLRTVILSITPQSNIIKIKPYGGVLDKAK